MAAEPSDAFEVSWPRLADRLHEAILAEGWGYLAMLTRAGLVESGHLARDDPDYVASLVDNYRINEAMNLTLPGATAEPTRPFRLPARRWNLPDTDHWVSAQDWARVLQEAWAFAHDAPIDEATQALERRFRELNNRLKDGAIMYMMRHAGALNGMQWRRLTKDTRREVIHVRLHAASGFLTTSIRVGGLTRRVTHVLPLRMLPFVTEEERRRGLDNHFGVRKLSWLVYELLNCMRDKTQQADAIVPRLRFFYDLLLAPILAKPGIGGAVAALGNLPTIVIATHGSLAQLPFSALHDGEGYLIDRFNVVQAPPLFPANDFETGDIDWDSMLGGDPIPPKAPARGLFAHGHFGVPGAARDAANLLRHFGERGANLPTEQWDADVLQRLSTEPGIGFLSAHVRPSPLGAGETAVQTSAGRTIPFSQIVEAPMAADLVVLAGCVSAGQSDWLADGENSVVSMYRRAGVPSVISTLWPVDDRAASLYLDALMEGLAAGLQRAQAHGAALRRTMRAELTIGGAFAPSEERLLRRPPETGTSVEPTLAYDHPRLWGAFVLSGAWR